LNFLNQFLNQSLFKEVLNTNSKHTNYTNLAYIEHLSCHILAPFSYVELHELRLHWSSYTAQAESECTRVLLLFCQQQIEHGGKDLNTNFKIKKAKGTKDPPRKLAGQVVICFTNVH
jgi:hypothetical protein